MTRRMKVEVQPTGEAEAKRQQKRAGIEAKLAEAESELQKAQSDLAEATEAMMAVGVHADPTKRDEAKRRVEDVELYVQHYKTALSVYDREETKALCREWDTRQNSVEAYLEKLEGLRPEAEQVASALVAFMVKARDEHSEANLAANGASDLVKELEGYGIQVREPRPSIVTAQSLVALALRKALLVADLSPHQHFTKECLSPGHYTPPEQGKDEEAA